MILLSSTFNLSDWLDKCFRSSARSPSQLFSRICSNPLLLLLLLCSYFSTDHSTLSVSLSLSLSLFLQLCYSTNVRSRRSCVSVAMGSEDRWKRESEKGTKRKSNGDLGGNKIQRDPELRVKTTETGRAFHANLTRGWPSPSQIYFAFFNNILLTERSKLIF